LSQGNFWKRHPVTNLTVIMVFGANKDSNERRNKRKHALLELVKTENDYVQYLQVFHDNYYLPMIYKDYTCSEKRESMCSEVDDPLEFAEKSVLNFERFRSKSDEDNIYEDKLPPDLPCIFQLHLMLLQELEKSVLGMHTRWDILRKWTYGLFGKYGKDRYLVKCVNKSADVGKIFKEYAPAFRLYSEYVGYFENASSKLNAFAQKNSEFQTLIHTTARNLKEAKKNNLASLMVMPVQRIPRYCMLLNAILENTKNDSNNYEALKTSLELVQQAATFVNERTRDIQQKLYVCNLQHELQRQCHDLQLAVPTRFFVFEEEIEQEDAQKYRLILFNDLLVVKRITKPSGISISNMLSSFIKGSSMESVYVCTLINITLKVLTEATDISLVLLTLNNSCCYQEDGQKLTATKSFLINNNSKFMAHFEKQASALKAK
jgi:hypothetical protein